MANRSKYSRETRERAVRLVWETEGQHGSQWAAICSVAEKVGCTSETLRRWVRRAEVTVASDRVRRAASRSGSRRSSARIAS